jgi:DNA-binding GntR family transcriptional regulator
MRLSEKAYQLIKERIISLELPPSSLIDQQSLMDGLGLGRTPIREALQRLAAEDLVNVVPRRGIFVSDISLTDLQKVFEARIVIEGCCARLAAQRITPAQIQEMHARVGEIAGLSHDDAKTLMDIDWRFHKLLYEAADNEFLAAALIRLYDLSLRLWFVVLDRLGDVHGAIEQHRAIFEALRARDAERAEALIRTHISEFQRSIKDVL